MDTQFQDDEREIMEEADKTGIEMAEEFFTTVLKKDKFGNDISYNFETIEGDGYRFDFFVTATTENKEYYFVVEVKRRFVDKCRKEWDDIMMEKVKWNAQFQYDKKYRPLYFNFEDPKGNKNVPPSVSIFDLISIRGHLGEMRQDDDNDFPQKTATKKPKVKVKKDVYYFPKFNKKYNRYFRWDAREQTYVMPQ